jgi:general secretion pathway protein K
MAGVDSGDALSVRARPGAAPRRRARWIFPIQCTSMARLDGAAPWRSQRGIALVLVLWVVALLAVIAANLSWSTRTEVSLANHALGAARARAAAEAGVSLTVLDLLKPFAQREWRADGSTHQLEYADMSLQVAVQDVAGLVDLNAASEGLLGRLMTAAGVPEERRDTLVDCILDWRDTDNVTRLHGAEDHDYEAAGLPYGAKDGRFETVQDLRQVLGVTREDFVRLAPLLTAHSGQPGVNPQVAPQQVLLALPGVDATQVEDFLSQRQAAAGTPLITPFRVQGAQDITGRTGMAYEVRVLAKSPRGTVASLRVVLRLVGAADSPYTVLERSEGWAYEAQSDESVSQVAP